MHNHSLFLLIFFFTIGCSSNESKTFEVAFINDSTQVWLDHGDVNKLVCSVHDSITSSWPLNYPIYQYQYGDIDRNGIIDLAVGVQKSTRYDSVKRNRLFLFQVRNNTIIPLWLGTSVGHPIVDFRVLKNDDRKDFIRIIGEERTGKFLVADYEWYGFGLSLTGYIKREISAETAKELFCLHN